MNAVERKNYFDRDNGVDMSPAAQRADLLAAMHILTAYIPTIVRETPVYTEGELTALTWRLGARATQYDTRPESCTDCGFRHTPAEGCYDGR